MGMAKCLNMQSIHWTCHYYSGCERKKEYYALHNYKKTENNYKLKHVLRDNKMNTK